MVTAKKPVIWYPEAKSELVEILKFFNERNGSNQYSRKLHAKIKKRLNLVADDCLLGEETDDENIRQLVVENYLIFYWILPDAIEVLSIRDARRDEEYYDE